MEGLRACGAIRTDPLEIQTWTADGTPGWTSPPLESANYRDIKADADVEGAGTDDRPPSPSPPSSPIFAPGSRSHMRGADGGAARRSAGASLSSHRCSVATPSSLGRPHEG